jgi:hypothetical protein
MSTQKPRLVLGQMILIICLMLAFLVLTPGFAKSQDESGLISSDREGKNTLASVKIDSVNVSTPGVVDVPILIQNSMAIGGFELEIDFCYLDISCYGAKEGEALSHDWEYFTYRILPYTDTLYKLILYGQADLPDGPGHIGVPLAPNSDYVDLVVMKFQPFKGCLPPGGYFYPLIFEWEKLDCSENTLSDSTGTILYVSQDSLQYDTTVCPHGPSISPSLEFLNGGIYATYPTMCRGDVNLNNVPYEVADYLLFGRYLLYGDSILHLDPEQQSANSDVNWDNFRWSVADYIHLGRVIQHDAPKAVEPSGLLNGSCWLSIGKVQASPHDTVALPFGYFSTSPEGWKSLHGIALRIGYNPIELTALSMDFSGSQIENWQNVNYDIGTGEIRFFATPEFWTTSNSDSLEFPGTDTLLLGKIIFVVGDVNSPAFLPISLMPDTGIYLKSNNVAGILPYYTNVTWMDYFQNISGGIQIGSVPPAVRGDLNLNDISYEVSDFLLFVQFLDQGPDTFWDPARQYPASDINADGITVTIADLVYMWRVIINDAPPIPLAFQSNNPASVSQTDIMSLGNASAHPGDTISVSLYLDNTLPATGISSKIIFDSTLLSIQSVDTVGTRLGGWNQVHPIVKPGAMFLHAMPVDDVPLPSLPPEFGVLVNMNFSISDQAPVGVRIPIDFQNSPYWQLYWGHYNAYTQDGTDFIQPTTLSGWIFTDVIRGDANCDGVINIADVVYLINHIFVGGPAPNRLELGDANCDGIINVVDVIYLINYLYIAGPPPHC